MLQTLACRRPVLAMRRQISHWLRHPCSAAHAAPQWQPRNSGAATPAPRRRCPCSPADVQKKPVSDTGVPSRRLITRSRYPSNAVWASRQLETAGAVNRVLLMVS